MDENYLDKLLITSINHMKTSTWSWPKTWDNAQKLQFLHMCDAYASEHEYYEQCAIIRDVKATINQ